MTTKTTTITSAFSQEVTEGLTSFPKFLSSKYIYDKKGDKLFQDIMAMPTYYLTDCEFEIFETHKEAISKAFTDSKGFDLIELGAGDGKKTKVLLKHLIERGDTFAYLPIDISQNVLDGLKKKCRKRNTRYCHKTSAGNLF